MGDGHDAALLARSMGTQLLEAALCERPPVELLSAAAREQGLEFLYADLEAAAVEVLAERGVLPCRVEYGPVPGEAEPMARTIFYQPSERILAEALRDGHPVVLATTMETQRFVDAVVDFANRAEAHREVWIWRGSAGRAVLERVDAASPFRPLGIRQVLLSHVPAEEEASIRRRFDGTDVRSGAVSAEGRDVPFWWRPADGEQTVIEVLIDDTQEGGGFPNNDFASVQAHIHEALGSEPALLARLFESARNCGSFVEVVATATDLPEGSLVVVPDAHHFLSTDPGGLVGPNALVSIGALKDVYHQLSQAASNTRIVLLCGDLALPKDLREEVLRVDLPLPSRRELSVAIRSLLGDETAVEHVTRLSEEAAGMTLAEVRAVLRRTSGAGAEDGDGRLAALRQAKRQHIARSPALELVPSRLGLELGGMDRFERWLETRFGAFSKPELARAAGIDQTPRGVLLLGIPGSGKSLAAKVVAQRWDLPLVRLDMGAIQDKWVGSSEARIREALRVVEAMAPCVMWIDEIDKGIAQGEGTSSHSSDLNIRATLLTWMQENRFPVFVVATANRFAGLPPELTRAGRFDARFFFGCPGPAGRDRILRIHLAARGRTPEDFDLKALVEATHGFTGAEIEQLVLDGLYETFHAGTSLRDSVLLRRAGETRPLIRAAGKSLEEAWELLENGRLEMASDEMLTRAQVARLIDPNLFRPVYCRSEAIDGFRRHLSRADRFLMASPFGGPAAVVMETGEPEWVYIQTNFRRHPEDGGSFKLLDCFEVLERNFVVDTLVIDHGLETLYLETPSLRARFEASPMFSAYSEMFQDV